MFKEGLELRGLQVRTQSPRSIKMAEIEKKIVVNIHKNLNNLQTQINLTKRTKIEELSEKDKKKIHNI